jgi:hypothetical protein
MFLMTLSSNTKLLTIFIIKTRKPFSITGIEESSLRSPYLFSLGRSDASGRNFASKNEKSDFDLLQTSLYQPC